MKKISKTKTILLCCSSLLSVLLYYVSPFSKKIEGNTRKSEVVNDRHIKKELNQISDTLQIHILRYDIDIFSVDTSCLSKEIQRLSKRYPSFLIQPNAWQEDRYVEQLRAFLKDPYIQEIYKDVTTIFPNFEEEEQELKEAFVLYRYYFPSAKIPTFYTIVAGIDPSNAFIIPYGDNIIINLDWYLGADYKYYQDYRIPQYIRLQCEKKQMTLDCFRRAIGYQLLPSRTPITLLDYMIENGKLLYFTELMFPKRNIEEILSYTKEQLAWAEKYQPDVWNYLVENELLFSKDAVVARRLIEDAPFSNPFKNSPGRIGCYIGWKIVSHFMEKHPETSISDLMKEENSRKILDLSGYKPLK